jgi:sortase A
VYWYDTEDILAYGVGQSLVSLLPGFGRVIILSGHNTTFFACLQDAAVGNVINFHTNYCDYQYTVTNVQVYNETELETLLLQKAKDQREELIMYTCYPFHAITGCKTDRLVVFANRTAGKDVDWVE